MTELLKGAGAFVCGDKTPLDLRGRTQKRHQEPAVIPRFQPSQGTPVWGPGTSDSGHHPIYQLEPRALQGPDLSNFQGLQASIYPFTKGTTFSSDKPLCLQALPRKEQEGLCMISPGKAEEPWSMVETGSFKGNPLGF